MRLDLRRVPSWRHSRPDEMETEIREPRGSVHLRADHARRAFCQRVVRVDLERLVELPQGLRQVALGQVDPAQVQVWEVTWLVPRRALGALEPGHRVVEVALLNQVRANVVVRVAEVRIDLDGALALRDRALDVARVRIDPAEEGMCFAGGADRDRAPIQLDGATEVSAAMSLETVPPEIQCLGAGVRCGHSSLRAPTPRGADRTPRRK